MANEIHIQAPVEQLERGKSVTVPVTLSLDWPLKVRGIHATFRGAEETQAVYTTTTTDGKGRVTTQTHTAVEHVDVVRQTHLLSGHERLGFFGNLSDALATLFRSGRHETLEAGRYSFEIEISVPKDAPPTHKGEKTRVFYELSVQVDVPLAFDLKAVQSFQLPPLPTDYDTSPVRTRYPDDAGRGFFDALFTPDVKVEMALAADKYRVGESIDGIFTVETENPISCDAIRVRLVAIENSTAHGHVDRYVHQAAAVEVARPGNIEGSFSQEFTLTAEATAPLSARGKLFSIDWFVQIELDVPWAKDPRIRAPIDLLPV